MMKTKLLLMFIVVLAAASARAATMSSSATAPVIDGKDIANYTHTGHLDKWFCIPGEWASMCPGQTFTTGSDSVKFSAITYQIADTQQAPPTKTYTIRVCTVDRVDPGDTTTWVLTKIYSETCIQDDFTVNNSEYMTWTLDTPVLLAANTEYGIDVGMNSSTSPWQEGISYIKFSNTDQYADGTRYWSGWFPSQGDVIPGVGNETMVNVSGDRVFHLDLSIAGARNPSPEDGATVPVGNVELVWENMDPNSPGDSVYVDVWFGTEPNELHPNYDMTKVVAAGENTTTWTVSAPTEGTYYWQVNSYMYGDPETVNYSDPNTPVIEGLLWSFDAVNDVPPAVDAGVDMMTWFGQGVPLDATVVDDGVSPLTYLWTEDAPVGVNVAFDPGTAVEDPTVTITKVPYSNAQIVNAGFEADQGGEDYWGSADGWTGVGGTWFGNWNPPAAAYSKIYSSGTNVPEGNMCGWTPGATGIAQVLAETLASDTQYELTVQVGNSMAYDWGGYNVQLLAGGTVLAEDPNVNVVVPYDDWALVTVPFDSTGVDPELIGQPLEIRLLNQGLAAPDYHEINFDDVKLTADPPFTPAGMQTVTLTLAVSDEGNPTPDTDTIEIDVYDNACLAAFAAGLITEYDETDLDQNCITDLKDLGVMLAEWLVDYSATAPVPKP
jgi:hypothetical protein